MEVLSVGEDGWIPIDVDVLEMMEDVPKVNPERARSHLIISVSLSVV